MRKHRTGRRLRAFAVAAVISALPIIASPTGTSAAESPDVTERAGLVPSLSTEPIIDPTPAEATAWSRRWAGLDASPAKAQALLRDSEAVQRGGPFGFPVAADELKDLQRRFDVQLGSEGVLQKARTVSPETFAGVWFDLARGKLVAAYTDADPGRATALARESRRPDAIEVVQMPYTEAALKAAADQIFAKRAEAKDSGADIRATGVQTEGSLVVVEVTDPTATSAAELAKTFDVPEDMLLVKKHVPVANDAAIMGGEYLGGCSSGAWARNPSTGQHLQVTAGHCGDVLYQTSNGEASGSLTVPFVTTAEQQGPSSDSQAMAITPASAESTRYVRGWTWPTPSLLLYLTNADPLFGTWDTNGAAICQAGYVQRGVSHCGGISSNNYNFTEDQPPYRAYTGAKLATYCRNNGDSGATVWGYTGSGNVPLVGFHKAGPGQSSCGFAYYTHQSYAASGLGISWEVNY